MKNKINSQIILCAYHDFGARYMIYSGIMENLLSDKSVEILLITNKRIKGLILDEKLFYNERIKFFIINEKSIKKTHAKKIQNWSSIIMNYVLNNKYDIYTVEINQKSAFEYFKKKSIFSLIKYFFMFSLPVYFLRRSAFLRNSFRKLILFLGEYKFHPDIYKKYDPKLLIVNSIGFKTDTYLLREAKKNGVKCISAVMNWDNTTTKGMSGCKPDKAIAWNNIMLKELINHHDLKRENIFVGGIPHYSLYQKKETYYYKSEFCNNYNLSINKKIIFFGTMSPTRFKSNAKIIELIANAQKNNLFKFDIQLVVRLHPIYFFNNDYLNRDKKNFDKLKNKYNNIIFCDPIIKKTSNGKNILHPNDSKLLANLIKYSDVILCYFSTLMLEGSLLNKPVINLFIKGMREFFEEEEDVFKETHLKKILSSGGVSIAHSKTELIELINTYLKFPNKNSKERELIKKTFMGEKLQSSPQKISSYILNQL